MRSVVLGVLHDESNRSLSAAGQVEVDIDGQHMIVPSRDQFVLRCGEASNPLTKAGEIPIDRRDVSSQSDWVYGIKGGSIQLNG